MEKPKKHVQKLWMRFNQSMRFMKPLWLLLVIGAALLAIAVVLALVTLRVTPVTKTADTPPVSVAAHKLAQLSMNTSSLRHNQYFVRPRASRPDVQAQAPKIVVMPQASSSGIPAATVVVTLAKAKLVHTAPSLSSAVDSYVADKRPLTAATTVLPVLAQTTVDARTWLRVRLPQRPDGATGWISSAGTHLHSDSWYIVVDRALRRASIYDHGRLVRQFSVIVGKPSTPTPSGHFFVAEILDLGYGIVTGPYALATSAYSNVYQEFEGGPGQVALHGIVGLYDAIGTASSHGCVRFSDADITWLATRVRAGTPIDIY